MEKRRFLYLAIPILIIIIFFCMYFYNQWYFKELYKKPKMYVYETFLGPANPVLMISDLKYKNELNSYYNFSKENKRYTSFSFPLKGLPQTEPVYVLGYSEDSLVAEIVSLYNRGRSFGGSFTRGYVSTLTLHSNPPPDSLLPKFNNK